MPRKEDVLDAPYFHVVFTVPEELNPVIYNNQKPIRVISRVFRGKYLMELKQLWTDQKLEFHGTSQKYQNHYAFKELLDICYGKEWSPYCKKDLSRGAGSNSIPGEVHTPDCGQQPQDYTYG